MRKFLGRFSSNVSSAHPHYVHQGKSWIACSVLRVGPSSSTSTRVVQRGTAVDQAAPSEVHAPVCVP